MADIADDILRRDAGVACRIQNGEQRCFHGFSRECRFGVMGNRLFKIRNIIYAKPQGRKGPQPNHRAFHVTATAKMGRVVRQQFERNPV